MKKLVVVLAAVALLAPVAARANGDPASDVLLTDQVFLPFEAPISDSAKNDLRSTVSEANKKGFKLRVAVITFTSDLGTATALWGHPQDYSKFLGKEIAFVTTDPLLVAMPSGFGFYDQDRPVDKQQQVLSKIQPGKIPTALAESTTAAVRALAAAQGVTLPKPSSGSSGTRDRLILGAAVAAFLLVLVLPAGLVRRRRRSSASEQGAEP
jgi:hypothetical protein